MGFRDRSGRVVPPAERPAKSRRGARVVVRTPDAVLLMRDTDLGVPGSEWWVTPGGGIDPGETPAQAAAREVGEETGLIVEADDLIGPIATRSAVHGYSDQVLTQHEVFFAYDVPERFEIDHSGFTEAEKVGITASGWFTMAQVAEMDVWPRVLPELFGSDGSRCLDLGEMEESTVPVGAQ